MLVSLLFLKASPDITQALIRDNFRCMLSGSVDVGSMDKNDQLLEEVAKNSLRTAATECCHIFSESTNDGLDKEAKVSFDCSRSFPNVLPFFQASLCRQCLDNYQGIRLRKYSERTRGPEYTLLDKYFDPRSCNSHALRPFEVVV